MSPQNTASPTAIVADNKARTAMATALHIARTLQDSGKAFYLFAVTRQRDSNSRGLLDQVGIDRKDIAPYITRYLVIAGNTFGHETVQEAITEALNDLGIPANHIFSDQPSSFLEKAEHLPNVIRTIYHELGYDPLELALKQAHFKS